LREGIDDTGIRAAFLKCAVEKDGLIGDVPRILAAVAAASLETDAPIMVHTSSPARMGLPVLQALRGHGVEADKIVIAHAGDSNDLDYLRALADQGAWLGCDRFNIPHFNPDADRVATLAQLVAEGYAERIHLGHDAACFYDFMAANPAFADEDPSYVHISQRILPALRDAGVTQAQLDQMLIDNPRRFFAQ
jgi:phosphotriesterase-related protein